MLLAANLSGKPGHGIVPVNLQNYCLGNSSLTYDIAKNTQLLRIWAVG